MQHFLRYIPAYVAAVVGISGIVGGYFVQGHRVEANERGVEENHQDIKALDDRMDGAGETLIEIKTDVKWLVEQQKSSP